MAERLKEIEKKDTTSSDILCAYQEIKKILE